MKSRIFPVHHSILASDAITSRILPRYGLQGSVRCRFFRQSVSDVYEVRAGGRSYFLKISMFGRKKRRDVEEEVHLLSYLHRHGVRVARPIRRRDGKYLNTIRAPEGARCGVLFGAANGEEPDLSNRRHLSAIGSMVGRMHSVADRIRRRYQRQELDCGHLIEEPLGVIQPFMEDRKGDFELIRAIGEAVTRKVSSLLPKTRPQYGMCHGDLHGWDVRIDENGVPTLFDFDSSGYGWRAFDIGLLPASHEWMNRSPKANQERKRMWDAVLRGYNRERRLTREEIEVAALTPPMRHIFLMGLVLRFTAEREGYHWAHEGFFNWHMEWFHAWAEENQIL